MFCLCTGFGFKLLAREMGVFFFLVGGVGGGGGGGGGGGQ